MSVISRREAEPYRAVAARGMMSNMNRRPGILSGYSRRRAGTNARPSPKMDDPCDAAPGTIKEKVIEFSGTFEIEGQRPVID